MEVMQTDIAMVEVQTCKLGQGVGFVLAFANFNPSSTVHLAHVRDFRML